MVGSAHRPFHHLLAELGTGHEGVRRAARALRPVAALAPADQARSAPLGLAQGAEFTAPGRPPRFPSWLEIPSPGSPAFTFPGPLARCPSFQRVSESSSVPSSMRRRSSSTNMRIISCSAISPPPTRAGMSKASRRHMRPSGSSRTELPPRRCAAASRRSAGREVQAVPRLFGPAHAHPDGQGDGRGLLCPLHLRLAVHPLHDLRAEP